MRRFYVEKIIEKDGYCIIPQGEAMHITRVLRMGTGDRLVLMDSYGSRFEAEIESAARREVRVKLIRAMPEPSPSPVSINLCQAVLKPKAMDFIIEKTNELGVSGIFPFFSERTVIRPDTGGLQNRVRHWNEIAKNASKQCGRGKPALISEPVSMADLLSSLKMEQGLKVVLWEQENSKDLKEVLRSQTCLKSFTGVIGPEGGFTEKEILELENSGFITATLGFRILKADTAAITLSALVQYEWGDLGLVQERDESNERETI